jgi:Predicted ATPase/kinase involved in NAD metabolism
MIKIAILGPESTGKSTLSKELSEYFHIDFVPEYSREYLSKLNRKYTFDDVTEIAKKQNQMILEKARHAGKYLISDTEMIVCKIWTEYVYGKTSTFIENAVSEQFFDIYLLCNIDLKWENDPLRENPKLEERESIFKLYINELQRLKANYHIISGEGANRFHNALSHIEKFENEHR